MDPHVNKNDLIHQLIIRRAEQERRRMMMEQDYDGCCCGMCRRKTLRDKMPTSDTPSSEAIKARWISRRRIAPLVQIDSTNPEVSSDAGMTFSQSQLAEDTAPVIPKERRTSIYLNQRNEFLDAYERYLDSVINRKDVTEHLDTYDPYEHRHHKKLSTWGAINHIIRSMLGVGMIKMPKVYKENGLYNGVTVTIAFVTVASFTMHIMVITRNQICTKLKIPWLSLGNTVKEAFNMGPVKLRKFSKCAKYIAEACVIFKQLILNMFLVRFLTLLIEKIFYKTYENQVPPESILSLFFITPVLYVSLLRNLRKLVFHSVLGNFLVIITAAIITYHTSSNLEDVNLRKKDVNFFSLTEFLNIGMLGLDSMELGLAVESRMQYPKSFLGIVGAYNIGLISSTVLVLLIGVFGYWKFGENVEEFLFDNLPLGRKMLITFAIGYIIMLSSTFALHLYLPSKMVWKSYIPKSIQHSKYRILWRLLVKQLLMLMAFLISFLPLIVRTIGIVVGVALMPFISITLPMILQLLVIRKISKKLKVYYMLRNITIIILSIAITGCCIVQMSLSQDIVIID